MGSQVLLPAPVVLTVPTLRCRSRLESCHARGREGKWSQDVSCGVLFGRVLVPRTNREVFVSAASAVNLDFPVSWRHFGRRTEPGPRGKKRRKNRSPFHVSKHKTFRVALSMHRDSRCGTGGLGFDDSLGHHCSAAARRVDPQSSTQLHPRLQFIMGTVPGGLSRLDTALLAHFQCFQVLLYLAATGALSAPCNSNQPHSARISSQHHPEPKHNKFSFSSWIPATQHSNAVTSNPIPTSKSTNNPLLTSKDPSGASHNHGRRHRHPPRLPLHNPCLLRSSPSPMIKTHSPFPTNPPLFPRTPPTPSQP